MRRLLLFSSQASGGFFFLLIEGELWAWPVGKDVVWFGRWLALPFALHSHSRPAFVCLRKSYVISCLGRDPVHVSRSD